MTIEKQLHTVAHLLVTAHLALRNEQTCKRLFEAAEVQSWKPGHSNRNCHDPRQQAHHAHRGLQQADGGDCRLRSQLPGAHEADGD